MAKLTEKQQRFIDYFIQSANATQAALLAGYSQKTSYSQGQRLLKNVEIKSVIDERLKSLESELIAKSEEILQYLTSVLRGEAIEEVIATVGIGRGKTEIVKVNKAPSTKDRLKAAEILCRIFGLFNAEKVEVDAGEILITTLNSVWIDENVG